MKLFYRYIEQPRRQCGPQFTLIVYAQQRVHNAVHILSDSAFKYAVAVGHIHTCDALLCQCVFDQSSFSTGTNQYRNVTGFNRASILFAVQIGTPALSLLKYKLNLRGGSLSPLSFLVRVWDWLLSIRRDPYIESGLRLVV